MSEYEHNRQHSDHYRAMPSSQQNWGLIIGVGAVVLGVLVMIVNLLVFQTRLALPTNPYPLWVQVGRLAGLIISLGVGGWLLWRLLGQRQKSDRIYPKAHLLRAIHYTRKIEQLLQTGSNGHEQQLLLQIQTWWQMIETMAQALGDLGQNDQVIQSDLHYLPGAIADLKEQLAGEINPFLRADLEQMLTQRQNQQMALEQLQTTRRRAEIQIERTIAVLGTIYSQLLTYRSTFHVVDYQHLADHVAEEVQQLQDYLEALQEVKGSRPA